MSSINEQLQDLTRLQDDMGDEYGEFLTRENLPEVSADELLMFVLTAEQRRWVSDFVARWEEIDRQADILHTATAHGA
jgi:hypothetical protein